MVLKTESEFSLWFFFALTRTCNKRNPELEKMRKSSGKDLHHVMIEIVLTMLHFSIAWGSLLNENVRYDWDDWVRLGKKLERKWIRSRLNLFVFVISAHPTKSSKIYSPSFNIKLNQQWTGNGKRNTWKEERGTENIERGKGRRKFWTGNGEI